MPARRGGFGGGLNPFGGGQLGSLAQYDIGKDLADLAVYQTEVAWGNGQATDADYLDALRRAAAAADPNTQGYYSAQNKVDDAVYRIGRSVAEGQGLDALIAFDQAALATMSPDNLRYRDILDSVQSEMAQRRSRDYGELVDAYNDGELPTETLLAWVSSTLGTISPDDPDFANWTNVLGDLGDRIQGEKDTQVYQDYQRGRMEPAAFLAYLTGRRDEYSPESPKYQEWANKLEDATVQVKDQAQAKADSTFFALYEEGKKSDASYLLYLRRRIDTMPADDPQRGEWQHRLNQATFSLTEDKLRFDAQRATDKVEGAQKYVKGRTVTVRTAARTERQLVNGKWVDVKIPAGTAEKVIPGRWTTASGSSIKAAQASMGKLMDFYTAYRTTLNPGSAEWRTVTRSIDTLAKSQVTFGATNATRSTTSSGGGSSSGASTASVIGKGPAATTTGGKLISPKYTLSNILGLFSINPTGDKKAVAAAGKFLALNTSTLNNALTRGDDVWLFQDPRYPGSVVNALNPDGSPVLDKNGKAVLVRGTAYLPVTSEAFSNLKTVESSNFMASAELALSRGKYGDYASLLRRAGESLDSARLQDAQYRAQNWEEWYDATAVAVDKLTMSGDYGGAVQLATDLAGRLAREAQNPYLDDTRRARLDEIGEKLADNKIMPTQNPDGSVYEGAVNLSELARGNVVLNPGWHHVLKSNDRGQPAWGPVFDQYQDGRWEAAHVTVHTTLGDRLVTGDAALSAKASVDAMLVVTTPEGSRAVTVPGRAKELTYVDERGAVQRAYSIDGGRTWIRPAPGMPAPTFVVNADLQGVREPTTAGRAGYPGAQDKLSYVDADTGEAVLTQQPDGSWELSDAYVKAHPAALAWYGQREWEQARKTPAGHQQLEFDEVRREPRRLSVQDAARMPMGAVNQHMTLAYASPSGVVNLVPSNFRSASQIEADKREANRIRVVSRLTGGADVSANVNRWTGFTTSARVNAATGFDLSRQRPVTYQDIAAQLPADTPARYDGYTARPNPTVVGRPGPSGALPALTQPAAAGPTVLSPSVGFTVPALKTPAKTVAVSAVKKAPPPPPRTPTVNVTSKPPAPPPVKTPTTTAGVYRPPTVTRSGPLR